MKKKLFSIVTLVLLVAVLGVTLCGCASAESVKDKLTEKGYLATAVDFKENADKDAELAINWIAGGLEKQKGENKKLDAAFVASLANAEDAKAFKDAYKEYPIFSTAAALVELQAEVVGKTVYIGTEQGIKDAKSIF